MPRRPYRDGVELSILGFGGMVLVGMKQGHANRLVTESFEQGVNYFDVAPFYGDGEAEKKLGISLAPIRNRVFLACKTLERQADGAREELERSLRLLKTDHFDLYQFHALMTLDEVDRVFAAGGAAETFLRARDEGKVRYIGFSAHSVEAALAMLDRFDFDSLLFPVNFICMAVGGFGPQVLEKAKGKGAAILALKVMAHGPWRRGEKREYSKCWYRPIEDRPLALEALRFAFSEGVTSMIPPGEEPLFRMALDVAPDIKPLSPEAHSRLLAKARNLTPLFRMKRKRSPRSPAARN